MNQQEQGQPEEAEQEPALTIWVDADASPRPVKEIVFRASTRLNLPVRLVANHYLRTPPNNPRIQAIQVSHGSDVADDWIEEQVDPGDIVITADIPLAARVVERGALGISPRGEVYTESNVRSRLSVRDFMHQLREQGVQTGGPSAFGPRDRRSFANALDRELTRRLND